VPHKTPPLVAKDLRCLSRVCTEGFGQRRKTIRNSFANFITVDQLAELGIDSTLRPENLSLAQFVTIANWLADQQQA
jgi:16S rRNA (adenine1518-N6/adenine1519-N6)-dimethyltransferase